MGEEKFVVVVLQDAGNEIISGGAITSIGPETARPYVTAVRFPGWTVLSHR